MATFSVYFLFCYQSRSALYLLPGKVHKEVQVEVGRHASTDTHMQKYTHGVFRDTDRVALIHIQACLETHTGVVRDAYRRA